MATCCPFVMQTEGVGFPEAVERLAAEAGLPVPVASPAERARQQRRTDLHQVVEEVCPLVPAATPGQRRAAGPRLSDRPRPG